jgi:hypothetical protein
MEKINKKSKKTFLFAKYEKNWNCLIGLFIVRDYD